MYSRPTIADQIRSRASTELLMMDTNEVTPLISIGDVMATRHTSDTTLACNNITQSVMNSDVYVTSELHDRWITALYTIAR